MKKAIVFDFDGTLTKKDQNIWKMLWEKCGYDTGPKSLYVNLYIKAPQVDKTSKKMYYIY